MYAPKAKIRSPRRVTRTSTQSVAYAQLDTPVHTPGGRGVWGSRWQRTETKKYLRKIPRISVCTTLANIGSDFKPASDDGDIQFYAKFGRYRVASRETGVSN